MQRTYATHSRNQTQIRGMHTILRDRTTSKEDVSTPPLTLMHACMIACHACHARMPFMHAMHAMHACGLTAA